MLTARRKFNIEGPIVAQDHNHVPPLERVDLDEILELIRHKRNFVMHAPRQTGKTSALLGLRDLLASGAASEFRCVYVNVEAAQALRGNVKRTYGRRPYDHGVRDVTADRRSRRRPGCVAVLTTFQAGRVRRPRGSVSSRGTLRRGR